MGNPHDEVRLVAEAIAKDRGSRGLMLDVGGHHGESFDEFAEHGWTVHCFEPNPANHEQIERRKRNLSGNVTIFPVAVSNKAERDLTFFLSDESTGISSLHPFHETHRKGFTVDAVTLADHCESHNISHIDFLKIDVEGHDFFVLQGINWDKQKPDVIVCEFEDRKTTPLGYTFADMAEYLIERGYHVIVSEWYPIVQYGTSHKWRCSADFPYQLKDPLGWGNLIAIRDKRVLDELRPNTKSRG